MITTPNITHYLLWRRRGGGWGFAASLRKLNGRIRPKLTFAYKGGWVGGLKFVKIGLRNIGTPPYEGLMWITSVLYIGNCELHKIRNTKTVFVSKRIRSGIYYALRPKSSWFMKNQYATKFLL